MNETMHANGDVHGAHSGDVPQALTHAATDGEGAPADAATAHGDAGHAAPLGPVDWFAWGAGILGIAAGLVVAACLYLSTTL